MVSPEGSDETVDAATAPSDATPQSPPVAALPPAGPPVYRPRSRRIIWTFVVAFLLAAGASAVTAWLLLR